MKYRLLLVLTAILFSTGGAAIKAATLTPWQVASFRSGVAAVALVLFLPEARRGWSWRVIPVGLAFAGTLVGFVLATRLTTAANAIFLQSTAPLYVLLIGPLLLHEKVRRGDLLYMAALACGMAMFFLGSQRAFATAPDPARGNVIAAVTGLTWALTLTGLRWYPATSATAAGNVIAFAAALPMALPIVAWGWANTAVIVYLGFVQIGLAYYCLTRAIRHVPAFEATSILLLEPALNPVWAWIVHGERPGAWAAAGGAIILAATAANTFRYRLQ